MREIKFRAWDRKSNIMLVGIELKKLLSYLIFQNCPNSDAYEMMKDHFKDIEWLQYTGLKDKNGKEMYESDLVKDYKFNIVYQVYFVNGCFRFISKDHREIMPDEFLNDIKAFEIIGNIYKNKDLIK